MSNVGRRSLKNSGFGSPSSADVEDATLDVDGSANSSDEVGKGRRLYDSDMVEEGKANEHRR